MLTKLLGKLIYLLFCPTESVSLKEKKMIDKLNKMKWACLVVETNIINNEENKRSYMFFSFS